MAKRGVVRSRVTFRDQQTRAAAEEWPVIAFPQEPARFLAGGRERAPQPAKQRGEATLEGSSRRCGFARDLGDGLGGRPVLPDRAAEEIGAMVSDLEQGSNHVGILVSRVAFEQQSESLERSVASPLTESPDVLLTAEADEQETPRSFPNPIRGIVHQLQQPRQIMGELLRILRQRRRGQLDDVRSSLGTIGSDQEVRRVVQVDSVAPQGRGSGFVGEAVESSHDLSGCSRRLQGEEQVERPVPDAGLLESGSDDRRDFIEGRIAGEHGERDVGVKQLFGTGAGVRSHWRLDPWTGCCRDRSRFARRRRQGVLSHRRPSRPGRGVAQRRDRHRQLAQALRRVRAFDDPCLSAGQFAPGRGDRSRDGATSRSRFDRSGPIVCLRHELSACSSSRSPRAATPADAWRDAKVVGNRKGPLIPRVPTRRIQIGAPSEPGSGSGRPSGRLEVPRFTACRLATTLRKDFMVPREHEIPGAPVLSDGARHVYRRLVAAGERALLAGGAVRDHLLGRPAKDVDIASSATPQRVAELFDRTVMVGAHFGVAKVVLGDECIEVVTFRKDLDYEDGRHPVGVRYSSEEEDAKRRDFTVNGLFYDLDRGCVVDYVGGVADLEARRLRAIGDPRSRFREDRLRLLRAIRFAVVLGFEIDPDTWEAVLGEARGIHCVSAERVRDELEKILVHPRRELGYFLLSDSGLMAEILPEVEALRDVPQPPEYHPEGDVHRHTGMVLAELRDARFPVALAALLHDIGKAVTFSISDRIRFNRHDSIGATMAEGICDRLRLSNREKEEVVFLVQRHMVLPGIPEMRVARRKRLFDEPGFESLLQLGHADCMGSHRNLDSVEAARSLFEQYRAEGPPPEPLLRGRDLIEFGMTPGPSLGLLLREVFDAQRDGDVTTREEALGWLRERFPGPWADLPRGLGFPDPEK